MPSDANGNYSLPDGYLAVTGQTVLASQHNPPLEDLAASMSQRVMATGVKPFSGPIKAADGSVSAPGITFNSATSSGIYKTADGLGVAVGGVQIAEFTAGGLRTGARYLGELIPYTGTTAQALTVFPYGQTLSRTTYAALWAFAQTEITAGNAFYNNGNGTTTFGIGDLRGRLPAGKDNMGGVSADRLSTAVASSTLVGSVGGAQTFQLTTSNLPPYTPSGSVGSSSFILYFRNGTGGASAQVVDTIENASVGGVNQTRTFTVPGGTFTGSAQGGTSTAFSLVQPTMIVNYLLFVGA